MTAQEKWTTTIQYMELIRKNYLLIKEGEGYKAAGGNRRKVQLLRKWIAAAEKAYRRLRLRRGKSLARARRDWLTAYFIGMMLFDGQKAEWVCAAMSAQYRMNRRYIEELMREAVTAVQKEAQEAGLLDG